MSNSRRAFLLGAGGAAVGAAAIAAPAAAAVTARNVPLLVTSLSPRGRGVRAAATRKLAVGDTVVLRREPDNDYDTRAVAVWTEGGEKVGYVPRARNEALANLLDAGLPVRTTVAAVRPDSAHPELTVAVSLLQA